MGYKRQKRVEPDCQMQKLHLWVFIESEEWISLEQIAGIDNLQIMRQTFKSLTLERNKTGVSCMFNMCIS